MAPTLLDRRPSALLNEDIVFARYGPPTPDWPWIQLGCWPLAYTVMVEQPGDVFARGAYTVDVFADANGVNAAELKFLATLGDHDARFVREAGGIAGHG